MKLRSGDKVIVIAGKDKGVISTVKKVNLQTNTVLVENVNKVKRHVKPGVVSKEGGILEFEKPIHASNVMYYSDKHNKPFRLGYTLVKGKKFRILKGTDEVLEN